jgi:hypothetical protein
MKTTPVSRVMDRSEWSWAPKIHGGNQSTNFKAGNLTLDQQLYQSLSRVQR